ncbi:MAG: protein kinase [Chloroflexi bacterium]|nr:protein kinase [Chloroflexota bacterium]
MPYQKFGRYEIERELGRGGMAVVYLARDPYVKRQVAVKVLPHQFTSDPQFRARFQREAEIIAALEHPHIVPIHDYGEQDEQLFLVMRYMTGGSLADHVRRGPLSTTEIAHIVPPLASALDKAHARGIIHRDLKPSNILFDGDGEPYISDFGIAKLTQASTLLSGNALVGTPVYMSPEQWRGEKVDERSDVYALGVMLYQILSGRLPYEASTPAEVMFKCLMEPPPRLLDAVSDLSPMLETVVARAMAKDRDERFGTAGELAKALQTAIRNAPQGAGVSSTLIEAAVPAQPETTPKAVEADVEELPPVAPPTVRATPRPTIPIAIAPEDVKGDGDPTTEDEGSQTEVSATLTAPAEAVEAEDLSAEAGVPTQSELPVEAVKTLAEPELVASIPKVVPPPARPATEKAPRPLARFALPAVGLAVIALLIVGGAVFGPGLFNTAATIPTEMSVAILETSSSPTRTISPSPALTLMPTITPTRTPQPTITPTPPPAWVTSFAEPILAAVADQPPDFQDDFSTRAGGWTRSESCAEWKLKYVDGEMVVSDCSVSREMWYTDFVAEMDARFLPGSSSDSQWRFHYRRDPSPGGGAPYFFDFRYSGDVGVGFEELGSPGEYTGLSDVARSGTSVNHVLVIAKDQTVALFVNDRPVYYGALPILWKNGGMMWGAGWDTGIVAFDNFKVWDISDIPLAVTPAP